MTHVSLGNVTWAFRGGSYRESGMMSQEKQLGQGSHPSYEWTLSSLWCGDPEWRLMLLLPVLCPLFLDKQCPVIR